MHTFYLAMENTNYLPRTPSLAERVRASLSQKRLPACLPQKVWVGPGSVRLCHGCGDQIRRAQTEYELQGTDERTYRLHADCYGLWLGELIRRRIWKPESPESPRHSRRRAPNLHETPIRSGGLQ